MKTYSGTGKRDFNLGPCFSFFRFLFTAAGAYQRPDLFVCSPVCQWAYQYSVCSYSVHLSVFLLVCLLVMVVSNDYNSCLSVMSVCHHICLVSVCHHVCQLSFLSACHVCLSCLSVMSVCPSYVGKSIINLFVCHLVGPCFAV